MDLGLRDKVAIVTGGGSNIGRGIAHVLAAEGVRLAVADRDGDQTAKVLAEAEDLGAAATMSVIGDLTAPDAGAGVVERVLEAWGRVDLLVNNLGWGEPVFFSRSDHDHWQRMLDLNLLTTLSMTQAVLEPMKAQGSGAIVCISSDAAFGEPRQAVYGAAKAGIIAFARTIAKEHGRDGIRVNVVCPGVVIPDDEATGAGSLWSGGREAVFDDDQLRSVTRMIPLRRLTEASDIGAAVAFYASDVTARQVTGQVISVSGGFAMP